MEHVGVVEEVEGDVFECVGRGDCAGANQCPGFFDEPGCGAFLGVKVAVEDLVEDGVLRALVGDFLFSSDLFNLLVVQLFRTLRSADQVEKADNVSNDTSGWNEYGSRYLGHSQCSEPPPTPPRVPKGGGWEVPRGSPRGAPRC